MESDLKERFERSCRLCAEEQEVTLMIFSAEAEAMLLHNKLNKYLLIEVDENDKLPKNICIQCCTKLQTVCDFIDIAHKSQEILLNRSIELDQVQDPSPIVTPHILDPQVKSEPEDTSDDESKITSMEINVDPMIVLQNSEPILSPSVDDSCQANNEDVSHLHGLDGVNVTIKLIKKVDQVKTDDDKDRPKPFLCRICARNFSTEFALRKHYWTHDIIDINKVDYTCSICKEEFPYKNKLIEHFKIHKTNETGECNICGRLFRTAENLTSHMAMHSSKENKFNCTVCGQTYDTLSNLKLHSISHSSDRPYECHFCQKAFKRKQDLKFHINQHTGVKPYQCPFCDKSFTSSGNCYSHRTRMHPGRRMQKVIRNKKQSAISTTQLPPSSPQPKKVDESQSIQSDANSEDTPAKPAKYKCPICAHTFMKKDNFNYHIYQHTGQKPFHCTFCTEKYVTRRGLLIHHNQKHPTKSRPLALLSRNVLLM
ncbi:uncharacterized protein [Epargyreus clarus]|uniref:uncharacterized protein n=1 Tax=Epargyreus clarus TaxID=520877 RepID=UPI003C2AD83C